MLKLDEKQLKIKKDFIKDYIKSTNAAEGSKYDANANVSTKTIATLEAELNKDINIQINRAVLVDKIKEMFGDDLGEEYQRQLGNHEIYTHDETSLKPYTYGKDESIVCIYKGDQYITSFEDMYNLVLEPETLEDDIKKVYCKYPEDLAILDKDGETRVTRLVKKKRHRDLVRVKTSFGEDIIVTDNHPMICSDNPGDTIQAKDSKDSKQYRKGQVLNFSNKQKLHPLEITNNLEEYDSYYIYQEESGQRLDILKKTINLTEEFGYAIGFFIAEGCYLPSGISICQKDPKILKKIASYVYDSMGCSGRVYLEKLSPSHENQGRSPKHRLDINSRFLKKLFKEFFGIKSLAPNKNIPSNILETNINFAKGILAGIIDGDGHVSDGGCINIRVSSRQLITQLTIILQGLGFNVYNSYQDITYKETDLIQSSYPIFGVNFSKTETTTHLAMCNKMSCLSSVKKYIKYSKDKWVNVSSVTRVTNEHYLPDFIYDITTESSTFISNNLWVHNCASISMYPFLIEGMVSLGGESKGPKHIESFCGSFINLIFAVSSQFAGAIATVEFLMYFDYFARKDYGDDYLTTDTNKITSHLQHVVYSINQPAAARGYQSVFWNISLFDKEYFESMFGDFVFPDSYQKPIWDSVNKLQKFFMNWFNSEREEALLTFPVVTAAMLVDEEGPLDEDFSDFCAKELSEGNAFFVYQSDSPDSLASCCFDGEQRILTRSSRGVNLMSFEDFHNSKWLDIKRNLKIFHNGSWVQGKSICLDGSDKKMFRIKTSNKKELIVSEDHLNPTLRGDIATDRLTKEDYLLFNNIALNSFPEKDENLTYEQGFLIGAFLGDGSYGGRITLSDGTVKIYETSYSLNEHCYEDIKINLDLAAKQCGSKNESRLGKITNNVYPTRISSQEIVNFLKRWTFGERHNTKRLNMECLSQSISFRKGILDGMYATDGGNSNRIYTVSDELKESLEVLITSLGYNSICDTIDRTDEKVVIRGEEYNRNFPLHTIRWYDGKNKRSMKDTYKVRNNSIYFKIFSIEEIEKSDKIYCFEMKNKEEPYFTLPNGVITHNCRLRNEVIDNTFSYSLGAGGVSTGSVNVITINMNRLIQDKKDLKLEIQKIQKYQIAYKAIIQEYVDAGILPVYTAGFITLDKQFLTIGINGMLEGAESQGLVAGNNKEYKDFVGKKLKIIFDTNKEAKAEYGHMFNTEFVPAENLGVKNAKWDKKDGYFSPRECFNSYFYIVEDIETNTLDKFILHGKEINQYLDGGSALHLNLEEYPSKENFKNIFKISAKTGCNYFCTNVKVTICNDCGYIDKQSLVKCSKCSSSNIDHATRVIGYLKRVKSFSSKRQEEEKLRFYHVSNKDNSTKINT